MGLRDYQVALDNKIDDAIQRGAHSILATCPTGGGKTHSISYRTLKSDGPTVQQAHRQELVHQISMALARDGIEHRILAPDSVVRCIIEKQVAEHGRNFIYAGSPHTVISTDTLLARVDDLGNWPKQVKLLQTDEGHHVLHDNKWGRACRVFPNALHIAWTGTARRPDRKSLRAGCGGIYDALVIGPTTRQLLDWRYLSPFEIYGPPPSIDVTGMEATPSGDYSPNELRKRAHKSTIVGDMLDHYTKLAPGKVGLGFLVDVEQAAETSERFNAAGWRTVWMSSRHTDDRTRVRNVEALKRGELHVIFNVDLFSEGVDLPRCEVILDGRPTKSIVRYLQTFGRLLRLFPGKTHGIYIDMVRNVREHRPPDTEHEWSLDVPEKRKRTPHDEDALTTCTACIKYYPEWMVKCPHCGHRPQPFTGAGGASRPEQVQGDLMQYSDELLRQLRGEADRIIGAAPRGRVPAYVEENWNTRAVQQQQLRKTMDYWAGVQCDKGLEQSEVFRLFWHRFGIDAATAETISAAQASELQERVWKDINHAYRN